MPLIWAAVGSVEHFTGVLAAQVLDWVFTESIVDVGTQADPLKVEVFS